MEGTYSIYGEVPGHSRSTRSNQSFFKLAHHRNNSMKNSLFKGYSPSIDLNLAGKITLVIYIAKFHTTS
jgi:hypothetical protein